MKVILDTNAYLSYLGAPDTGRTIAYVVRACLERPDIELIVPTELIAELRRAANKYYWRQRITQTALENFIDQLVQLAELPPPIEEIQTLARDRKDDYLLAHALINNADCLVTGDRSLLELDRVIDGLEIMLPAAFLTLL